MGDAVISAKTRRPWRRLNIDPERLRPHNYEVAKSRGGGVVYVCDGFGYRSNKKMGNTLYLICTTRGCKATARFDRNTDILAPKGDHTCEVLSKGLSQEEEEGDSLDRL